MIELKAVNGLSKVTLNGSRKDLLHGCMSGISALTRSMYEERKLLFGDSKTKKQDAVTFAITSVLAPFAGDDEEDIKTVMTLSMMVSGMFSEQIEGGVKNGTPKV